MGSELHSCLKLEQLEESGIQFLGDNKASCSRKSFLYYNREHQFIRSLVCNILSQYVSSGVSVSKPVKCIDVFGGSGISGLLWKKNLGESVDVKINNSQKSACEIVNDNALKNKLQVEVSSTDPCIVLHERGYNFIYLDCTNDAAHYLDAAFRNISRNGMLVVTAKDDCSLHGSNPDVAMRRYNGRITRTLYFEELGIRLVIAAMARVAAKYNKSISVMCCVAFKNTFTIAVMSQKGPLLANKSLENIRLVKHCMVCENRKFYPLHTGFTQDPNDVKLDCHCALEAPGKTDLELGPIWSDSIFNRTFIEGMLNEKSLTNLEVRTVLELVLEETRCPAKEASDDNNAKRLKLDFPGHPPFYFNLHKHHPQINQLMKLNKVVERLRELDFRASKTHFDRLAVRTDAPLSALHEIMINLDNAH